MRCRRINIFLIHFDATDDVDVVYIIAELNCSINKKRSEKEQRLVQVLKGKKSIFFYNYIS